MRYVTTCALNVYLVRFNVLSCKVIVAEGEIKASLALRQAAENIAGSPESLQVISSPSIIV